VAKLDDFYRAYDVLLGSWPVGATPVDVPTAYGMTRVNVCGPESGAPLLLLPGGGATSTVWAANVEVLARRHRVYAVDIMQDAGRSVSDGTPLRSTSDLFTWLDEVLDGLGLESTALVGHSYGAMIALGYTSSGRGNVDSVVLLDPTSCFAGLSTRYLLRAAPLLLRPTAERQRALIRWETGGVGLDERWLELAALGAVAFAGAKVVVPRRPKPAAFARMTVPTAVLLAGSSRAHDAAAVAATIRRRLPSATVTTIEGATHHTMPMVPAAAIGAAIVGAVS
jgi:pimeloyl-ACP methyl ester carboxylesterase